MAIPANVTARMMVPALVGGGETRADTRLWPGSYDFLTFLAFLLSQNNLF